MSSREPIATVESPADIAAKHQRVLLRALQSAHPVMYRDRQQFIHTLTFQVEGGGVSATVYLAGISTPVIAYQVQLREVQS